MSELSPNAIITVLRDQAKKSKQAQKKNKNAKDSIHCLQHMKYLEKVVDRDRYLDKARQTSISRKQHLHGSHHGTRHDSISNLKVRKPEQVGILHE